ncbi:MAG: hypothetical protein ACE5EK_07790 [Nitrospinales bacterium]
MGFFSTLGKTFGIGDFNEGENTAQLIAAANQKAMDEIKSQFGATQAGFQPFIQAGGVGLNELTQGSTLEGLSGRLRRILGGDVFESLKKKRLEEVRGQLAAGGLTRSGTALKEIADIPPELALALENLATGRASDLAQIGRSSVFDLGRFGSQKAGRLSDLITATGEAQSEGFLADRQAQTAGDENLIKAVATGLSLFF